MVQGKVGFGEETAEGRGEAGGMTRGKGGAAAVPRSGRARGTRGKAVEGRGETGDVGKGGKSGGVAAPGCLLEDFARLDFVAVLGPR